MMTGLGSAHECRPIGRIIFGSALARLRMRWLRREACRPDVWEGRRTRAQPHAVVVRSRPALALGVFLALAVAARSATAQADLAAERARMVTTIEAYAKRSSNALGRDSIAPEILKVVGDVPRHEFVPAGVRGDAYADRPLPIGYGQTISQPFIVALMTDLMRVRPGDIVLEVGTGSGYQAAVLAHLARRVYTIEIVPGLADSAAARLQRLGYGNVAARPGDGYYGWEEAAPFDGIMVTAAASHVPPPLLRQLKPGGRMVIPLGAPFALQHLVLVDRNADGRVTTRQLLPVAFVPLTGGERPR
jgi:protein-L-isoaspartate(D-aspartate) O-methyltransferase